MSCDDDIIWIDYSTYIIVNAVTKETVGASRYEETACLIAREVSDFDRAGRYYVEEVTLH